MEAFTPAGMGWLIASGVAYTSGIAFYAGDRIPYKHAIWNIFELVGSGSHIFSIL